MRTALVTLLFLALAVGVAPAQTLEAYLKNQPLKIGLGKNNAYLAKGLPKRMGSIRRHLAGELGLIVPGTSITVDPGLKPDEFVVRFRDTELGRGVLKGKDLMAIGKEPQLKAVPGQPTVDPAYGMPGKWIAAKDKKLAEKAGCLVFTSEDVVATVVTEAVRENAAGIIDEGGLALLLKWFSEIHPLQVASAASRTADVLATMRYLLSESIPLRDLDTILEVVVDSPVGRDPEAMADQARLDLSRSVYNEYVTDGKLEAVTLDDSLEQALSQATTRSESGRVSVQFAPARQAALVAKLKEVTGNRVYFVILASDENRRTVRTLIQKELPLVIVVARSEVPSDMPIKSLGKIGL